MIAQGQFIKVIFRNSTQLEGVVESWSDSKATLTTLDGTTSLIIMNVIEDVMLVKIMDKPATQAELEKTSVKLQDQFEEIKAGPSADDLRLNKLADLKALIIEQDKKIVAAKLKENKQTSSAIEYKYPSFLKKDNK